MSLLDRLPRAFSSRKHSEGLTPDILLNPAIEGKTTITIGGGGGGVRFAGSVNIHDLEAHSKRFAVDEVSWVAGSDKDMHSEA